jgi:hypothetical protein
VRKSRHECRCEDTVGRLHVLLLSWNHSTPFLPSQRKG